MLNLLIGAWITISVFAQQTDTTSMVLLEFSETMSIEDLLDVSNYKITSEGTEYKIYKIGIVNKIEDITPKDTSMVVLITERLPYKKEFFVTVENVKDKAGNKIGEHNKAWFYFNGFAPSKLETPRVDLKK